MRDGLFAYIELYTVPQSYERSIALWKRLLPLPFIIHAPHFGHGANLSDSGAFEQNTLILREAMKFADALKSDYIIVHGGFGGDTAEVIRQVSFLRDKRFVLENIPVVGLDGQRCSSYTPQHMAEATSSEAFAGFVLDMGHAVCMANSLSMDWREAVAQFVQMEPVMYHLSDGDLASERDAHYHIGQGNFPIAEMLDFIPEDSLLTLETPKDLKLGLLEARQDCERLMSYYA